MQEIIFHGRGGQGAVVASRVLAAAAFAGGAFVQAFPAFGLERRGAPVLAYTRIDSQPVSLHIPIYEPDHVIVLDASLLKLVDVTKGLKPHGWVLVNTDKDPGALPGLAGRNTAAVNASEIAAGHRLGSRTAPIVNTAILGAFARATGIITLDNLESAIRSSVHIKPDQNVAACRDAFEAVTMLAAARA